MSSSLNRNDEAASLIRYASTRLIVRQLQSVLKQEGQPISGLKAHLQRRLTDHIESVASRGDAAGLARIKNAIYHPPEQGTSRPSLTPSFSPTNGYSTSPARMNQPAVYSQTAIPFSNPKPALNRILFKESPFYTCLAPLSTLERCPVAASTNRNNIKAIVTLTPAQVDQLAGDQSLRCMVYCAVVDQGIGFTRDTDIAFPHQVEIRVNDVMVPGLNTRGLKNKPGSTRPADITNHISKKANYRNEVALTYALTQKEFAFIVNLVKTETVEHLVEQLRSGDSIAKNTVISDMIKKNEDSDLVTTSTIMSLKCPLSTLRIDLPVRSTFCGHVQCFDATSFLQLQQQAPTWTCPTCNKSISFKALVVDRYFDDILKNTPKTVESVTIDAEARWSVAAEASNSPMPDDSDDDDNDIVEIPDSRPAPLETLASMTPVSSAARDSSIPAGRSSSSKRPVSQVIDLTLSDDDDEPPRPAKRVNAFPTPSSMNSDVHSGSMQDLTNLNNMQQLSNHSPLGGTPDPFYSSRR